jgi:hypothetical protein
VTDEQRKWVAETARTYGNIHGPSFGEGFFIGAEWYAANSGDVAKGRREMADEMLDYVLEYAGDKEYLYRDMLQRFAADLKRGDE